MFLIKSLNFLLDRSHCDLWVKPLLFLLNRCAIMLYSLMIIHAFHGYLKKIIFLFLFKIPKLVEHQFDNKIKIFQSDNGGEFTSNIFVKCLNNCGIIHQISCSRTPQQNGVAKRKHMHIVETGLTILFHTNLTLTLWVEAFM